jgi:hypothetical protein
MAKQRNMYTWVDRARAVDVVIIGMEYGQSSGYNRREEQTHLVRIWMTMQRIMSGLGGGLAEMPRKHQEKLNALRKLEVTSPETLAAEDPLLASQSCLIMNTVPSMA